MGPSVISLTRLEFGKINIEANHDFIDKGESDFFPQLDFNFNKVLFQIASDLTYPENEIADPRHFTVMLRLTVKQGSQEEGMVLPYSIVIEGSAYVFFKGKEEGLDRFKVVRGTAYLMLYGAFRECIANLTGRSCHGVWFIPSPNFNLKVEKDAPEDFELWEAKKKKADKKKRIVRSADVVDVKVKKVAAKAVPKAATLDVAKKRVAKKDIKS